MTTDSLFMICQPYKDAWVSNGTHAIHYQKDPYSYELWDIYHSFLGTTRLGQSIQQLASENDVDMSKGWVLVTHI